MNPSTSLLGLIESNITSELICLGNGNCTKIPSTSLLRLSSLISFKSSFSDTDSASEYCNDLIPTSFADFPLFLTYIELAASLPTIIVAKPGVIPFLFNANTALLTSFLTLVANAFPSIISAVIIRCFKH